MRHESLSFTPLNNTTETNPQLITRQEHSRNIEDAEKYEAVEYLKQVGLFISLDSLDLHHGRVADTAGEDWKVDESFQNGGNDTNNANVNKIPALSTDSREIAEEFAAARAWGSKQPEIHKIVSEDPDAMVIDGTFNLGNRSDEEKKQIREALNKLSIDLTEGSPLDFEHRDILTTFTPEDFRAPDGTYTKISDLPVISQKLGVDEKTVKQVAGSLNARLTLTHDPERIIKNFIDNEDTYSLGNGSDELPINQEYVANWLRNTHIVGVKRSVRSATIGKDIEPVFLFDLEKVNTEKEVAHRRDIFFRRYGRIARRMADGLEIRTEAESPFIDYLSNSLYATPKQLVDEAKKVGAYKETYEADAGNWEKFSLSEHTETVLRVFDKNYADRLPANLLPVMRLALLTHDLGKPEAVSKGEKHNQHAYNAREADNFMKSVDVNENLRKLIVGVIGESQKLTTYAFIQGDVGARKELLSFCHNLLTEYGAENVTKEDVQGLANMCLIVQTCDSAAYTDMAITRSEKLQVHHRNSPSFNGSFHPPVSITRQDVRLKTT
ncbi:hypothetical protein FWF93_00275 [Candidatus Saccharibacteria bacterium]|nr:hypothetical protein [Candidatus Saccharibacteria bacterium]